jgi:hypothetical protein
MYCSVYGIGGISHKTCQNAISEKVEACVMCDGAGREPYPDPTPECPCGRPVNHIGTCAERNAYFDAFREPTQGEKEFIKNLIAGQSPTTALVNSSLPDTQNPERKAARLMNLPHIKQYLVGILDKAGATDAKIAKTISEGLDATDMQIRMEKLLEDGKTVEKAITINRPDWANRARFVEIALKAKGYLDKDDAIRQPTKITVVNRFSRAGGETEESGTQVEVG